MSYIITDNPVGAANDVVMARTMAEALHQAYPNHLWAVTCDGALGFADVRNLALSGNWGFRIKLDGFYSASDFKRQVLRAGGEILERYRVSRGVAKQDELAGLSVDFAGNHKADH